MTKKRFWLGMLVIAALITISMTACDLDDNNSIPKEYHGTWKRLSTESTLVITATTIKGDSKTLNVASVGKSGESGTSIVFDGSTLIGCFLEFQGAYLKVERGPGALGIDTGINDGLYSKQKL
jgi:hypothetical protein